MFVRRSRSGLSPGCRDQLALASSLATILALLVGILGLARAMLNWTLPQNCSEENLICSYLLAANRPDLTSSMAVAARASSQKPPTPTDVLAATPVPSPTPPPKDPPATATPTAVLSNTTPITVQPAYTSTAPHLLQAPALLSPPPDAALHGEVHFQWQWDGVPLSKDLAFDLLIWSEAEDQEHQGAGALGVIEPAPTSESRIDLDYVQSIMDHGGGLYYWSVIVVRVEPYERVGLWGEKRAFTYVLPEPPAEPPPQNP